MSPEGSPKKRCGVYWDIGDTPLADDIIKEILYLVRSLCQSNDLDVHSMQLVSNIDSISGLGDDTTQLITLSDYSKDSARSKIADLIEHFLNQTDPGCPVILIDPTSLFSSHLNNFSTRFDFEIYFIHLERTFDPSLEPIADNHFYLEGSSIFPNRPLNVDEIGTLEVKNYQPSVDKFNLIREIDCLFKSFGRIENSTFSPPELSVVWVFFPSQQLALNAAAETQKTNFRGSSLQIVYLDELPCPIASNPILASLVDSSQDSTTDKVQGDHPVHVSGSLEDTIPLIAIEAPDDEDTAAISEFNSAKALDSQEMTESNQICLEVAEALSQLSANSSLDKSSENIKPTVEDGPSNDQIERPKSPATSFICSIPLSVITSVPPFSNSGSSKPSTSSAPRPGPSHMNVSKSSNGRSERNSTSGVSSKSDRSIGVIAIHGRPKEVDEKKFYADMHGMFKHDGRMAGASFMHDDSVLLGFKDDKTAKKVANERNGMIYFGVSLTVSHIKEPTPSMIAMLNTDTVKAKTESKLNDNNLIVSMKSLKRSVPRHSAIIKSVTDIGTIAISNIPETFDIRNTLAELNGIFKRLGALRDSAIWYKSTVWMCFPDKKSAQMVAAQAHGMNFRKTKLTVNYIENPPNFLLENYFVYLLTPKVSDEKSVSKSTKRVKRSNAGSSTSNSSKSSSGSKTMVFINQGNKPSQPSNQKKTKSGSNVPTGNKPTQPGQSKPSGSKANGPQPQHSSPIQFAPKNGGGKDNNVESKRRGETQVQMEEDRENDLEGQSSTCGNTQSNMTVESIIDDESSATYCRKVHRSSGERNVTLESYDSIEDYMLSEAVIHPLDGLAADTRFDYYQSSTYHNHDYADLVKDALRPENFIVFREINFKLYPNKFWLLFHILRLVWPHGVMKIALIKDEVYVLMVTPEAAQVSVEMLDQRYETNDKVTTESALSLKHLKATIPVSVPSAIITLIRFYSATYSPWCFTENWDLKFLALLSKGFVGASEFSLSKGLVSGFGALFIKSQDSKITVAFSSEKRLLQTMIHMRRSIISNFDFHVDPEHPDDLLTLIRDYDLTGSCARLSQIALQQTFKLLQYKSPPPFVLYKHAQDEQLSSADRHNGKVEINFNTPSARSCEPVSPIPTSSNLTVQHKSSKDTPLPSGSGQGLNFFIKISYNARHIWCYLYDILSKLWPYRIVMLIYKQEHRSQDAETWLEVPWYITIDDVVNRLSTITYLKTFEVEIMRPSFDLINSSISTGSSPWIFSESLKLRLVKIAPSDQSHSQRDVSIYVDKVKYIVEDEHAIFVKLMSNVIWVSFPDKHSMYQGMLLINYEQRLETNLTATPSDVIPKGLFSSINVEDLVGVNKDLAIANSLSDHNYVDQ